MQLPSGITVTDEYLKELADSMVTEHASYGFEDWNTVIHGHTESIAVDEWGDRKPLEDEKDRAAVIEAVEPVARAFTDELAMEYQRLYDEHLEHKTW